MPDIALWLANKDKIYANPFSVRAVEAWSRIQDHPTVIEIHRGNGSPLAPQTVRIEENLRVREDEKQSATTGMSISVVFGVRGHPTVADTDIQARDTFYIEATKGTYQVLSIILADGEVQAVCEAKFG